MIPKGEIGKTLHAMEPLRLRHGTTLNTEEVTPRMKTYASVAIIFYSGVCPYTRKLELIRSVSFATIH